MTIFFSITTRLWIHGNNLGICYSKSTNSPKIYKLPRIHTIHSIYTLNNNPTISISSCILISFHHKMIVILIHLTQSYNKPLTIIFLEFKKSLLSFPRKSKKLVHFQIMLPVTKIAYWNHITQSKIIKKYNSILPKLIYSTLESHGNGK